MPHHASGPETLPRSGWHLPLAFFAGTWLLLTVLHLHAPLHLDTARDLLIALDCVRQDHCPGLGPRSSFGGLMQGALWSHLLELHAWSGLGLGALERLADLLLSATAALVPLIARAMHAPATALTWALWFPITLITSGYPRLWNPTPWPLVAACFVLALVHALRRGSTAWFTLAAAGLALAIDVHVASALLLPSFLALVVAGARRLWLALPLALATLLAILAFDSPAAFAANDELLRPHAPLLAAGSLLAIIAGARARRSFIRADPRHLQSSVLALCGIHITALGALAMLSGHGLSARYFAPIVAPLAILLAARLDARLRHPPRRWHALALGLALAWHLIAWIELRLRPDFRLIDAAPIAAELYGRNLAFGDLYRRGRGPDAFTLLSVLAALEPPDDRLPRRDDHDLLVLRVRRDQLPRPLPVGWSLVELSDAHVAVIVAYTSWLRPAPLTICPKGQPDACETFPVDTDRFATATGARWSARAHAGIVDLRRFPAAAELVYRLPLHPTGDLPRRFVLFDDDCGRWSFAGGADTLTLSPTTDQRSLEFTVTPRPRCRGWLPPFAELPHDDPALAALLAAASSDQ